MKKLILLLFILISGAASALDYDVLLQSLQEKGITVEMQDPSYEEGCLRTVSGGVITGPALRIQAQSIEYYQTECDGQKVRRITAEGCLIASFQSYVFVGDKIEYDFETEQGIIYNGHSGIEPWFFGGNTIRICGQECIVIENGYLTTSESSRPDWSIQVRRIVISKDHKFVADDVRFQFQRIPLFWLPSLKANLDSIFDSPVRYRVRWGGKKGLRLGMIYEVMDWNHLKTFLRFDYRMKRGPGGGIETYYHAPHKNHWFHTVNYIANDFSIDDPSQQTRYRLEGVYHNEWDCARTSLDLVYDYLSDKEMATDYDDQGLDIKTAQRTQFNLRRQQDELAIVNLFTRVRINDFQTIKQELPSVNTILHPLPLGNSGLILDNHINAGYYDFVYEQDETTVPDFHASRLQFFHRLYRPFNMGALTATPEASIIAILYSSGPDSSTEWLASGFVGGEVKSSFYRIYGNHKHVAEPYIAYQHLTQPTISPNDHFIFDITDGWYYLNALRLGMRNLIYKKPCEGVISPTLTCDLYTYGFYNTPTIYQLYPKAYVDLEWQPTYRIKHVLNTAWDFERESINYINLRSEVTISEDAAFSLEYRHRSAFAWRKSVYDNFILDSFRPEQELRDSLVSDRRDTLLCHFFYRIDPGLAAEFRLRHGWHRYNEPSYTEYEFDLLFMLRSSWQMRASYQKTEGETRLTFYFNLVGQRPDYCTYR
ncbi:MAG: hypothetical protein KDK48_01665 [Chlamydiia bacterium]|nr:hypothetical protein [Chlamydiia bacterium]